MILVCFFNEHVLPSVIIIISHQKLINSWVVIPYTSAFYVKFRHFKTSLLRDNLLYQVKFFRDSSLCNALQDSILNARLTD